MIHQVSACAVNLLSVRLFVTPWTVARQAPLSTGYSRPEYWSEFPFASPEDLSDPGINPGLLHCRWILYPLSSQGSPLSLITASPNITMSPFHHRGGRARLSQFAAQGHRSEVFQSSPTLGDPMDCSSPGSSIHGIFLARVLEWVAISFSRKAKFLPGAWSEMAYTRVPCAQDQPGTV